VATLRSFSALDGGTLEVRSPLASRGISIAARIGRILCALEARNTRRRWTGPSTWRPRECAFPIQLRSLLGDLAPAAVSMEGVLARATATSLQACASFQAPTQTWVPSTFLLAGHQYLIPSHGQVLATSVSTSSTYLAPIRELGKALSEE
jgi:hypothetical protein